MVEISSALTSINALRSICEGVLAVRDTEKAQTIKIELSHAILKLQAEVNEIQGAVAHKDTTIRVLEERIRQMEADQTDRQRYHLAAIGIGGQYFAYEFRPATPGTEEPSQIPHLLCQPCFDTGRKAVLQSSKYQATCPVCKLTIPIAEIPKVTRARRQSNWIRDW